MIYDDFDEDDNKNSQKEVSLASTKLVVGQHLQILAERMVLNMTVGRQDDEVACAENMIDTLSRYLQVLRSDVPLTEDMLKAELASIYESSSLLSPEELAEQLKAIRAQSGMINIDENSETGLD